MKNFNDIEKLVDLFEKSNLTVMEVKVEGLEIKLDKRNFDKPLMPSPMPVVGMNAPKETEVVAKEVSENATLDNATYVTSPLVGTFHQGPTANAQPFVKVGDTVHKGQKLCMIEAMKVMNEITAQQDGKILEICVKDNSMVEYGQKLFKLGD